MVKLLIQVFVISITQTLILCVETQRRDDSIERVNENNNVLGKQYSGMFIPYPTVSLDIWKLLQTSVQNEIEKELAKALTLIRQASELSTLKYYPKSNLNLVKLGEKNYFFSKHQRMSWIDAASFCRLYNMDLVSVETKEEDQLIIRHLQKIGLGGNIVVYTSGHKIGSATYKWINGAHLIYGNWDSNQPANYATENCLVYWSSAWHDFHCVQHEYPFICEEP